jgi:type VII secretion protein EccE
MTEAPAPVRAVARPGGGPSAASPAPSGPATITARRRSGYLGLVSIGQVLLAEAFVVTLLALLTRGWPVVAAAVLVGGVVLVIAFGRFEGRWWTERTVMRWRFQRRRGLSLGASGDPRLSALRVLAPDLDVRNVVSSDGTAVGVGQDTAGWFAVVAVSPPGGIRGDGLAAIPVDRLARALADEPGAVLQLVIHTIPAPSSEVDSRHRCTTSYRELLESHGQVPAGQLIWVAVRLDARTFAESVDLAEGAEQVPALVAALARRVGRTLSRSGLVAQVLEAEGVLDALARSCDLEKPAPGTAPATPREHWQAWASAKLVHVCFWMRVWPRPAGVGALVSRLLATSAAMTSVAVVLQPRPDGTDVRCLVRVAARTSAIADVCRAAKDGAARAGGQLFRLDGEQAAAVYASAPTGGGMG